MRSPGTGLKTATEEMGFVAPVRCDDHKWAAGFSTFKNFDCMQQLTWRFESFS
jgi:hypothetical protein